MHKCFEGTKVWATILLEQFQNRSGLETANAKNMSVSFTNRELYSNIYLHALWTCTYIY